jgi:hypothetical protein
VFKKKLRRNCGFDEINRIIIKIKISILVKWQGSLQPQDPIGRVSVAVSFGHAMTAAKANSLAEEMPK